MSNKGQSISINTIIIAAIALAVLVVLFAIFTGRIGGFTKGLQETDTCAQKCASLNKERVKVLSTADSQCDLATDIKISGRYQDAPEGCCCK